MIQNYPKPEPHGKVKARADRRRMLSWTKCRAFVVKRDGDSCKRCGRWVSDDVPVWYASRRHVNHKNGRRGDRLFDPANCETLCQACHMPQGRHVRRP